MVIGFSVDIEEKHKIPTVHVKGEIDIYTCPKLRSALSTVVESGQSSFILDLDNIQYIDSTGLGTIAHIAQNIQSKDGEIYVICTKPQIKKIFQVSGLENKNITLFENETAILKVLN